MTNDLWAHQRAALAFLERQPSALLHVAMGGGKTRIAIEAVRRRRLVLVLTPRAVIPTWEREMARWDPSRRTFALTGDVRKRAEVAKAAVTVAGRHPVALVVNFEAAWRAPLGEVLQRAPLEAVIVDESQRIKAPGGKASRWVRELRRRHPDLPMLLLSGTPAPNGPLDLWAQLAAATPHVVTRTFAEWRSRYAISGPLGPWHILGYRGLDEIAARIAPVTFHVDASAVERPDLLVVDMPVRLEGRTRAAYEALLRTFVANLREGRVTVTNRLTQLLRLQQLTGGVIVTDDGEQHRIGREKAEALREVLDELDPEEPVVVFARFRADLDAVHEVAAEAGRVSLELSGRRDELARWQGGEGTVLAVQMQAGSVGISLVRAAYGVVYSLGYSLGDYLQALARLHRPGQTRPVTITRLVAESTIDERVIRAIEAKRSIEEFIVEELTGGEVAV
jgi:SNF2 family DNA or RNA helicase